ARSAAARASPVPDAGAAARAGRLERLRQPRRRAIPLKAAPLQVGGIRCVGRRSLAALVHVDRIPQFPRAADYSLVWAAQLADSVRTETKGNACRQLHSPLRCCPARPTPIERPWLLARAGSARRIPKRPAGERGLGGSRRGSGALRTATQRSWC